MKTQPKKNLNTLPAKVDKTLLKILLLVPFLAALGVLFSSLAFVPVPWPDDSAFYFVAKELFKWPPRWVMLPQAPFEPSYRIFNFNTMPLYPILIGLGRFIGIDGSFLLKIWPLGAWALSGSLIGGVLYRKGLPFFVSLLITLSLALDPELRWAATLIRPESLIGLFGAALVLGLTFGFPNSLRPTRFWDPIAALLALAAYSHFNAIHLLFPLLFAMRPPGSRDPLSISPRRAVEIGLKTLLYLSPWFVCVAAYWKEFLIQMDTQWYRLSAPNGWLSSIDSAIKSLFQQMGTPTAWPSSIEAVGVLMWAAILTGIFTVLIWPMVVRLRGSPDQSKSPSRTVSLMPAFGWVLGSLWLWNSKPEVWFVYYIHLSLGCFLGIWLLSGLSYLPRLGMQLGLIVSISIFGSVDVGQALELSESESWHWSTHSQWLDCIDSQLSQLESKLNPEHTRAFRVWDPTFPDITIELSRRHPDWEFSRTNDFSNRIDLAVQHGWEVDAVVVPETIGTVERNLSEKAERVPEIQSLWMLWKGYFLNRLYEAPGWKPNRFICQRGRWQAFLFMKVPPEPKLPDSSQKR